MSIKKTLMLKLGVVIVVTLLILLVIFGKLWINNTDELLIHRDKNISDLLEDNIDGVVNASIKNYLASGVDVQLKYAKQLNNKVKTGELILDDAKNMLKEFSKKMIFGKTGYSFILNSEGVYVSHKSKEGASGINESFIKEILNKQNGFVEYRDCPFLCVFCKKPDS